MKIKILAGIGVLIIICVVLMSGCTTEKKQDLVCNPPYILVGKECCLDQNNNSICDKDETPAETKTGTHEEEPVEKKLNESETEKIEVIEGFKTEREEVEGWCLEGRNYATGVGGGVAMTNDVKEYKGRWMCHNNYFLSDGRVIHMYWTKYEEEVYRVITYPDGTVEETKVESGIKEEEAGYVICENITDSYSKKNECYINLAVSKGDASICDPLIMEGKDTCYKEVAISKGDPSICDKIGDEYTKGDCYNSIAVSKEDASICGKIPRQDKRDDCYNDIALSRKDQSVCSKIESLSKRNDCYNDIAISKGDSSICDKIENIVKKDDCYGSIAISQENSSICYKIRDDIKRDNCFKEIALSKKDPLICSEIKIGSKRDDCYKEIALSKKDISICNKIESESKRELCHKSIGG